MSKNTKKVRLKTFEVTFIKLFSHLLVQFAGFLKNKNRDFDPPKTTYPKEKKGKSFKYCNQVKVR